MAKILDKKISPAQKKLIQLRQEQQRILEDIENLSGDMTWEKEEKLKMLSMKLNKRKENIFRTFDREAFADQVLNQKLQKYDVKQYMDYRKVNHGCLKEIFKAVHEGASWENVLENQKAQLKELQEARKAQIVKLETEKKKYLEKHSGKAASNPASVEQALENDYRSKEAQLDEKYNKKQRKIKEALDRKLEVCETKIKKYEEHAHKSIDLPEDVLLRVEGLKMHFGGLKAVDDLTFDVKKGEIFGLIGPNGAGKTTVFNCITRFYDATAGNMYFENKQGEVVDLRSFQVHDVILQGITRTFQNVELIKEISVLDNLLVACTREYRSGLAVQALGLPRLKREEEKLKRRAEKVLKFMGLENYASWLAYGLPYGVLKKVEIARALMSNAKLIIMDEPAAGLNDTETAELTETIRRIRDEFNVTILLVEHDMSLVMNICDTVCAISFGKMLAIGSCEEIQRNKAVQEAYLGVEEDA